MKNMKKIFLALSLLFVFSTGSLFAGSFFSANVGGMLSYNPDVAQTEYDPNLKLNAYIESQFNFADNIWSHFNFSLKTDDFLSVDLFSETDSKFRIDEISVIIKSPIEASTNYFGVYMGAYDPIGSDLFFQRYFGLLPTSSVLTKSWLGQAGSILYPHFGIGIADVVKLHNYPLAIGLYAYVNNEDEKYYVFNADLRFGAVFRYFAIDIAGGLGAPVSLYLAAAGIGTIGLVDADVVDLSNLQRQVIHFTKDVGIAKVESAKEKIQAINPDVKVDTYQEFLDSSNALDIIKEYDFIVDGTDNFPVKFLINDACVMAGKPFSHGGILRFNGQTFTHLPGTACYRCMFKEPPPAGAVPTCSQAGVLGAIAGMLGTIQAAETLKYFTGVGELWTNRLLTFDAKTMQFRTINVKHSDSCLICGSHPTIDHLIDYEQAACDLKHK